MRWPLSRQILLPMVGILLLTIGAASALSAWLASRRVRAEIESQLAAVAQTLSALNFPLETAVLRHTRGLTGADFVVADAAGKPLAASDSGFFKAAGQHGSDPRQLDLSRTVSVAGTTYFHAVVPLDRRPVGGDKVALYVFYPEAAWREARWQAIWPPLATGAAAVVLVVIAAFGIALRVTRPIQQLQTQVERIAQGDFRPLPTPANDDEVKDLAAAINRLADRLARYEREIRQSERLKTLGTLGGGIAHQVRNAATGCRIALDLHQRDCPLGANGHTDEEPLAVAVRQLSLIETHIQRLLALGRPSAMEKKPVALAEIVEQALSLVRPMAQHVGVKLAVETSPLPFAIEADSAALVQMLVNLLVNAVQAAAHAHALANPQDAADDPVVILRTEPVRRDRGRVAVGDPGPGPSGEIQGRLFEPFATDKPGGTGLGLVVARQIAEDHRGTIGWRREGERTWFFVELPLTPGTE